MNGPNNGEDFEGLDTFFFIHFQILQPIRRISKENAGINLFEERI